MREDMAALGVQRHVGEQHVVHLRDGAGQPVAEDLADREGLEIEAAARMAKELCLHGRSVCNLQLLLTTIMQSGRSASTAMMGEGGRCDRQPTNPRAAAAVFLQSGRGPAERPGAAE